MNELIQRRGAMMQSRSGGTDWEQLFKVLIGDDTSTTELVIPEGITKLRPYAIDHTSLTKVVLPSTYTTPGNYDYFVVGNNTQLTSLSLGGLVKISERMFGGNSALTSVTIPASVGEIRANAFRDCTSLATVILERTSGVVNINYAVTQIFPSEPQFYVPDDLVDAYKAHTKWGADPSRIHPMSDLTT